MGEAGPRTMSTRSAAPIRDSQPPELVSRRMPRKWVSAMLPRRSMLAASPKNDAVKAPGETLEKSVTRSTPYSESMSALKEAAARGVSCSVLPRPNTVSIGALDRMPNASAAPSSTRSASTMICSMSCGSAAASSWADWAFAANGAIRESAAASSQGTAGLGFAGAFNRASSRRERRRCRHPLCAIRRFPDGTGPRRRRSSLGNSAWCRRRTIFVWRKPINGSIV